MVATCVSLLVFAGVSAASSASAAGFGIERYSLSATEEGGSEDTQAGSHPYEVTAGVAFSQPSAEIDDLHFELPPGVVLDGRAISRCSASEFFEASDCGEDTAVGVAMVSEEGKVYPAAVYNLMPEPGKLAQLGFVVGATHFIAAVALRPSNEGMTLNIDHILATRAIAGIELTLWGVPGEAGHDALRGNCATGAATDCLEGGPESFVTLPTACGEALDTHTTALVDTWQDPGEWLSAPAAFSPMSGCDRLAFDPEIGVTPEVSGAGESSAYDIGLGVPQSEEPRGLAVSELQDAQVTLPAGVSLSLAYIDGMEGCSEAQIALESSERPSCPNASTLGSAEISTPLLPVPLAGRVYLAAQNANPLHALVGLYLDAEDPTAGVTIKLVGQIVPNPATGQLTIVFDDMPQMPIGEIALKLYGGARGVLDNPQTCGPATSTGRLAPWSGDGQAVVSSSFEVSSDHPGEACPSPLPFEPSVSAGPAVATAGSYTPFTLTIAREDQEQNDEQDLAGFSLQLPAGLEWLFASVAPCGEPQAREGACPQASQIGTTTVSSGDGPAPAWFTGAVYLTEGTPPAEGSNQGAPYGLSVVIDVIAGPLDLGEAVIRAPIAVDPITGALSVTSDPLPQLIDGLPLQLRTFEMTIDRSEFLLNSVICDPGQIATTVQGSQGSSVQSTTSFTDTGCQNPPAIPAFTSGGAEGAVTGSVALDGGAITVQSSGEAQVKLTCTGTSTCRGKLTLTVKTKNNKGRKRRHSKTAIIGTATFSIRTGRTVNVELTLNPAGRALLGTDHGRLSASLTVLKSSPAGGQAIQTHSQTVQLVQWKAAKARKP